MMRERIRETEGIDDTRQHRQRTIAWLKMVRQKLDKGDYEGCAGALIGAKHAVNSLLPVNARVA